MNTVPFDLPDGTSIEVPRTATFEEAEAIGRKVRPDAYKASMPKPQEGFFANLKAGAKSSLADAALGIGSFGDEKAAREAHRASQKELDNTKQVSWDDVEKAKGVGDTLTAFGGYARDSVARSLPYMGAVGAGALAGTALGPVGTIGGAVAGGLGAFAVNAPMMYGSNLARQDKENPDLSLDKTAAAAAAAPQALLDSASTLFLFGKFLPKGVFGTAIEKLAHKPAEVVEKKLVETAQRSMLKAGAIGAGEGALTEMPTELAQQILERYQAGLPLTGDDANKEYKETLIGAGVIGGALGPYHGVKGRNDAQATLKERAKKAADAARADAFQKDEAEKEKQAAFKKTPEYLKQLDEQYTGYVTNLQGLMEQRKALGKPLAGTSEAAQAVTLGEQIKKLRADNKELAAEHAKNQAAITHSKIDAQDLWASGVVADPAVNAGTPDMAGLRAKIAEKRKAETDAQSAGALASQYINAQAEAARNYVSGVKEKITDTDVNDYVEHIVADPAQAAAALKAGVAIPGATKQQNKAIWGLVKMQLAEKEAQARDAAAQREAATQQQADETAAQRSDMTAPTEATDPTQAWRESLDQDNDVAGESTRTGAYAYNGDEPSQQRLPGTPPPLEPGKVEAFAPGEYLPGTEITDPKTARAHQAYTELRAKYERAMAEYERVANTGTPAAIEARKTLAALSRAMDEAARQLNPTVGESTRATPKEIDNSGIDDLLNRALEPAAGNGPPALPIDLEQSVQRLAETRRGLFEKFTAALSGKISLQEALGNIPDRDAVNVRGKLVPTEDRWEAKRDKMAEADTAVKQARSELIAAAVEEIKKQRELAGKLPLAHDDAALAKIIGSRLDSAYANTSNRVPKGGPKTASGTVDKGTETKIKARMAYVQNRTTELEATLYEKQGPLTKQESDNIYAELRQLDDEQARLHGSLREINREFDKVSKERQVALDRQLATINARIRNMRTASDKADRRITGGASAFVSSERRSELGRLEAARRSILERQSMGHGEAMMHQALQDIITNLTVNRNLPTRANAVKEGLRKGATGNVSKLRELVLGGRQFPGHEVETGSTEFGKAYELKSGEAQFKAGKDGEALVQRMREEELAELNDAAKDPRYDDKTRTRIDSAIEALHGKLNDPVTEADVARAKERFKPETGESGDLFGENLPKDIDRAGAEYDAARDAAVEGKKEFGQALGGMKNKSPLLDAANKLASKFGKTATGAAVSTYKEAKARLDAIRAKLPALKQQQEDARSEVHAAVDAKVSNDAMEADANLKAVQRTAAAVMQQMKQRRDAATGPTKAELSENMQMLTALIRELREELRPQLASIRNEHGLSEKEINDFYAALMPKKPSGEALRNAAERDNAATMHEVDKEMTSAALIDALEHNDAVSVREIERLLDKIDSMGEDGRASTGAALQAVQAKYDDLMEKIRVERDWAAKIKKERAPTAKKIAAVEDAISSINKAVAEIAPNADSPMSAVAKMVVAARETYKQWQDALNKAMETIDALERHGVPDKDAKTDARSAHFVKLAGQLQDDYYKQTQSIAEANTAKNPAALKAVEAAEKRYEESVERAGELQRRLEAIYKPESRVDAKGLWPADKFGTAVEPPTPQVVRGTYGTAYAKDKSQQTSDARKAADDRRLARKAESGAPAIEFRGEKEMTIVVPEETSTDVRFKLVEWLRAKGHVAAAEEIENDAAEVVIDNWIKDRTWAKENTKALKASIAARDKRSTVVVREALSEADIAKAQKAATAQFAAAVRMGERQTAIRPQRSKASSKLNTGVKRGRPTKDAEENTRLGLGEMSVGDVNAPDVESRVDKSTVFAPQDEGVQPDLTVGQIKAAKAHPLNKMSHSEAAQWLAERIKNPLKKALAMRVAHFLKNSKGTIEFSAEFDDKGPGSYNNYQKRVTLSPRIVNDEAALADVLLHELTHAATMAGMRLNPMLRAQMRKLVEHVSKWLETTEGKAYAEAHPELLTNGEIYGLKNIDEFVAETFSSSAFQQLLNQIPEQKVSALERFVRFLGRLFGANTPAEIKTLESVLKLSEKAMKETRRANEGGIGRLEGTAGMYVGESANMPEPMRILGEKAKAMLAKGMSKEAIWDKTGWFQSGDGKWRVEISDSDVRAKDKLTEAFAYGELEADEGTHPLGDLLDAPKLYAAYPALKDLPVELYDSPMDGAMASWNPSEKKIRFNLSGGHGLHEGGVAATLLHEIQHYVQDVEGFSSGTNSTATYLNLSEPESARKAAAFFIKNAPAGTDRARILNSVADGLEKINAEKKEAEAHFAQRRDAAQKKYDAVVAKQKAHRRTRPDYPSMPTFPGIHASDEVYAAYEIKAEEYKKQVAAHNKEADAYDKEADALEDARREAHAEVIDAIKASYDNVDKKANDKKGALWDKAQKEVPYLRLSAASVLYNNKHGELEARDTASRKDMTAAERRATTPYKSTGVQADEVVYAPKRQYANSDLESAVGVMVGGRKDKLAEIRAHATGLEFRTRFIDAYAGIKEALKAGDPTKAVQVTYDLMNFAQRNHFVQQAVMHGTPTRAWWGRLHGKDTFKTEVQEGASLKNVSDMLGKVTGFGNSQAASDAFTLYALAKRAQTDGWDRVFADLSVPLKAGPAQAAEIEKENARRQKARAYADTLANDKDSPFKLAYAEYQAWNKGMLQFAQQAGIISEEEFRRLAAKQNYTPLFRADKFGNMVLEIDQGRDITVGRLADEPHMQQMLGGSGQVMDFFTASVRNASVIIDASLHNIASREAVMSLYAMGAAHPVSATEKGDNIVEFRGPDKDGKVDLQRFAVDTAGTAAGHIPTDLLVKGFAGVPASLPGFVRLMGVPAQLLRKAVTRNPLYMVRQLIRDPMSAYLTTGAKFNPITDTLRELSKALSGKADDTLDRRGITGGALFADNEADLDRLQQEAQTQGNWWNIGYYMAALDHGAHAADAITRRNVYNGAIKAGASEIEATLAAYESMPFSKRGTSPSTRYLNHMIPFLSAMIQGWDVMYRAAKGDMPLHERVNVRNKLRSRGMLIAGMTMMYAMASADDEDYKKANTSERLNNWFVHLPGLDNAVKVPIPFELGVIFKMVPEALVRIFMSGKDAGDEFRDIGGALANMAPNLIAPQAMLPVAEVMLNRSFFTGRDIEGKALQGVDIGQRYDKNTSELSKLLGFDINAFGTQVGLSPKMLEYMMSQYTGGLYQAAAAIIDNVLPSGDKEKPTRTLAQMPLFKTVLLQEDAGGEVNRLYDKIEKFTRTEATFKKLLAEGNVDEAKRYIDDNKEDYAKAQVASKAKSALDKFSSMEKKIIASDWSADKKRAALDNIQSIKTRLAQQYGAVL